jgi:hypothetical protein
MPHLLKKLPDFSLVDFSLGAVSAVVTLGILYFVILILMAKLAN